MGDTPLTKQLRLLRKREHYTQKYVADEIGTTRANYSHYETGITIPSNDILGKLAHLYGASFVDLVRLSAISKREELEKIKKSDKVGIEGIFIDIPKSNELDPLYLDFIKNCPEMSDRKLTEWMEPKDIELVYYFHKLSLNDQSLAMEVLKLIVKNGKNDCE